jgi:hypothetical protein
LVRELLAARDTAWRLAVNVLLLADLEQAVARVAKDDLDAVMKLQVYTKPSGRAADLLAASLPDAEQLLAPAAVRYLRSTLGPPHNAAQ